MGQLTDEQKQLVEENYNLVHYVIHKYFPNYIPGTYEYEDLSNQGFLALCLAAIRYDPSVSKFSTYACSIIFGNLLRYVDTKSGWAFHIRKESCYEHVSYRSLNDIICDGDSTTHTRELSEIIPDIRSEYETFETNIDILNAFKKANSEHGEKIFELKLQGLTQYEIAEILGISQSQVNRTIHKAKDIYTR